ncbi:MAG TPA: hypothetical protein VHZ55_31080, partial [Bryobacteraceae bacterium]|nr:hypothetical protein [Bryobacteraceae bacterium]
MKLSRGLIASLVTPQMLLIGAMIGGCAFVTKSPGQLTGRRSPMVKLLVPLAVLFLWAASTSYGQQPEDLHQQLEQLKREYQQKLQELEKRLAALEKQSTSVPAPAQAAPTQSTSKTLTVSVGEAVSEGLKNAISGQNGQSAQGQLP